uniref:Uncharacterized protein n=1 Tax=viral metagenome TaxID=1070528 RepID=A0A6C0D2X1_9ZZZZ
MINVLQKVTTFPLEMIEFPLINTTMTCSQSKFVHAYYTDPSINDANDVPGKNAPISDKKIKELKENDPQLDNYKRRFITYNAIYNKLFANNLNLLKSTNETTVVVFPTMNQSDKGSVELNNNPNANLYYYDKFKDIKSNTNREINVTDANKIYYVELIVFNSETKEEYAKSIKSQLNEIKKNIIDYNKTTIKQRELRADSPYKPVQNLLFIIDTDKKGLFTGFYKRPLSKEKQDILNKEYTSFLSGSDLSIKSVVDAAINLTFTNVVKESKLFTSLNSIKIGTKILQNEEFDKFITELKELYKKNIDKEYKKSLELNDNIKKLKVFYKIDNADKILDEKIKTGSNQLYCIYTGKHANLNVIGYFLLISEERNIYRFKEDKSSYNRRKKAEKEIAEGKQIDDKEPDQGDNQIEVKEEEKEIENKESNYDKSEEGALDITVQMKESFGRFKYVLTSNKDDKNENVRSGYAEPYLDKTEGSFKWFNLRDIDASLLNKDVIKYYSQILFDKKSLIEYLKSKQKYTDKTILSYEFLKINDSPELSEYCDFIHKNYKSNIDDPLKFELNPFKSKFNDKKIIKNILDIVFDSNTPIYLRASKQTKDEARTSTTDSYKVVEYKLVEDFTFKKDKSCKPVKGIDKNKCQFEYDNEKKETKTAITLIVTKSNIKDVSELKAAAGCKTKKNKLIYDYKKLFKNVTTHIGRGYFGGGKISSKMIKRIKNSRKSRKRVSRKRRLKTKRYK